MGLMTAPMMDALVDVGPVEPSRIVSRTHTPKAAVVAEQLGRRLVYITVLTLFLVVPAWGRDPPASGEYRRWRARWTCWSISAARPPKPQPSDPALHGGRLDGAGKAAATGRRHRGPRPAAKAGSP